MAEFQTVPVLQPITVMKILEFAPFGIHIITFIKEWLKG
jgi:hypothetical protein